MLGSCVKRIAKEIEFSPSLWLDSPLEQVAWHAGHKFLLTASIQYLSTLVLGICLWKLASCLPGGAAATERGLGMVQKSRVFSWLLCFAGSLKCLRKSVCDLLNESLQILSQRTIFNTTHFVSQLSVRTCMCLLPRS